MLKFAVTLLCLSFALSGHAQHTERELTENQIVTPYRVEVAFNKTLHILFPSQVTYVDLGSLNLIAGKADGAGNVVRVKAAVENFTGETNFSVITADGCFYSFVASYSDAPARLNIEMEDWLHKDPYNDFTNRQMYIRLDELSGETPLIVSRMMYTILKKNTRELRTVGSIRFGMVASLQGVYVHGDLLFLHTSLKNRSKIPFDIDFIRFKIVDKKVAKRTAIQETFVQPVRVFNEITRIEAGQTSRNVFAFGKFTIPDDKVLTVEIYEKGGGRHITFNIENKELINARTVDELKIE